MQLGVDMLSKVRRFFSFQMENETNVMIALTSFLFAIGQLVDTSSHQGTIFRGAATDDQNVLANKHCMRR